MFNKTPIFKKKTNEKDCSKEIRQKRKLGIYFRTLAIYCIIRRRIHILFYKLQAQQVQGLSSEYFLLDLFLFNLISTDRVEQKAKESERT